MTNLMPIYPVHLDHLKHERLSIVMHLSGKCNRNITGTCMVVEDTVDVGLGIIWKHNSKKRSSLQ
jgi:hypothetical protein